jgi:hypothetical protein
MDGTLTVVAEGGTPGGQTPVPDTTPAPVTPGATGTAAADATPAP